MVDISKYLQNQLELSARKSESKKIEKEKLVSLKSIKVANRIAQKQNKILSKKCKDLNTSANGVDSDDDFIPSCDEGDDTISNLLASCSTQKSLKKIIDDGDKKSYDQRINSWRMNLETACAGQFNDSSYSADINYVLNGHTDFQDNHELQNKFYIPKYIWKQLYKYQRIGVKWLWELHQVQSGGLLGDEMGLGKTVQIIAFLTGLSKTDQGAWNGLGPSIIVAPATVIYQWVSHFHYWSPQIRVAVLHHSGSHVGNHNKLIRDIHRSHGLLLITYAGIVKYCNELLCQKWHYLILDEGHKIRNPDTQVSKIVKKFQTPHKLLITGSPMQNSLQELWSLFDFMRPGLLGTYTAFMDYFAIPITQGGYANATEFQEATALEIAKVLKDIITPYMLRRTKSDVQEHLNLPEKNEQVLFCTLTQEQRDLYIGYLMSETVRSVLDKESRIGNPFRARVLVALSTLRKICNHPDLYLYEAQEDFECIDEVEFGHWKRSGKMTVVQSLLKIWKKQGHRVLIFSQSRAMLCLLEQYLQNQKFKYLKMDGTVSVGHRQNLIKTFNEKDEYLVFLATTRVGGLGVNLTGADRVIIYDPDWNPATDSQAKERAWRIGQCRNVTVYRLLTAGTIEEKIYQRQVFKQFLSNKILIDPNTKNVLTTSTLQGLFTFEELNCEGDTETASLFKHTKVKIKESSINGSKASLIESEKIKKDAMKRMAKEISTKIGRNVKRVHKELKEDSHEYKKKRGLLLNAPKVEEPEFNIVNDTVTKVAFESVLSELDIVNMHTKKDYEENLIKEVIIKTEKEDVLNDNKNKLSNNIETKKSVQDSGGTDNIEKLHHTLCDIEEKFKKVRKRTHSSKDETINLIGVKKVKILKHKLKEEKNDDDYVLSKLFAKASVKNALQHDAVVGLAEKEKKYRIKEEAIKKAKDALKAIKFSSK